MDARGSVRIESFYLGCLAHASYLIGSGGIAAVIDPQRDIAIYLDTAERLGLRIGHVIETHLHADFVSGHLELARKTGAPIYLGSGSGAQFPHVAVKDGDSIQFGNCRLDFLSTPGHTIESISILMNGAEAVFTGDTLFVGDVGRPDLSPDHTPQQLAALLYRSLHEKLLTLPDETVIYPAHGAGSLCGRQMGPERSSTIGRERRFNYALQAKTAEEFVQLLTDHLPVRPEYFGREVELNRQGAVALDALPEIPALSAGQVAHLQKDGAILVDTRSAQDFATAHVPGSVHVALTGQFASWAARILGLDAPIVIVGEDLEHVKESRLRLARVGIENVKGYLADGVAGWIRAGLDLHYIPRLSALDLHELLENETDRITVLDVREPAETGAGAIPGAINIPLGSLASRTNELDPSKLLVVHCKGGYRSSIAASLLRRAGFTDIADLTGGYDAFRAAATADTGARAKS